MAITVSEARWSLSRLIEKVDDDRTAVEITAKRGNVVLMSADEYKAWQETAYLFHTPANSRRLLDATEAAERGEVTAHPLDRMRGRFSRHRAGRTTPIGSGPTECSSSASIA